MSNPLFQVVDSPKAITSLLEEVQREHRPVCGVYEHPGNCEAENHGNNQLMCSHDGCLGWPCVTELLAGVLTIVLNQRDEARDTTWEHYRRACAAHNITRTEAARLAAELETAQQEITHLRDLRAYIKELVEPTICTPAYVEAAHQFGDVLAELVTELKEPL